MCALAGEEPPKSSPNGTPQDRAIVQRARRGCTVKGAQTSLD